MHEDMRGRIITAVERAANTVLFTVGPIFVAAAVVLISIGVVTYFDVVFPRFYVWDRDYFWSKVWYCVGLVFSVYMVVCIVFHYYMAIRTKPGGVLSASGREDRSDDLSLQELFQELEEYQEFPKTCKKCHLPKPERAHHCSVCKQCVLRFDHHCPWIANCVGHFNHRYFLLFMTYLAVACFYFAIVGWDSFLVCVDLDSEWDHLVPRPLMALTFLLAVAIGLALTGLGLWHYFLVLTAQTTVEFYNNQNAKCNARSKGEVFVNPYNLGPLTNLKQFFNVGKNYKYPVYTIFLPIPVTPSGNGKSWEKNSSHYSSVQNMECSEDDD